MKKGRNAASLLTIALLSVACSSCLLNVPLASRGNRAFRIQALNEKPIVLAIAGNVAGDPTDTWAFNGGNGRPEYSRQKATADIVGQINPDAVLLTGNAQYNDGAYDKYLLSYAPTWGRFQGITHPAIGAHDYDNDGYFRFFGAAAGSPDKTYYSFDLGAWHIVALNSICSKVGVGVGSEQERWLRQDLEANKGKPILAYWFNARFSSGPYGSDSTFQPLWQALFDYHAQLVVNGSDHIYERFAPQGPNGKADPKGIRQFTSGLGGATRYTLGKSVPNSEINFDQNFGVLKLTLSPDAYEWEFIAETGSTFTDKGRQSIEVTPPPLPTPSPSPTEIPSPSPTPSASPIVLAVAGDIAGDPTDWYFNRGEGRPGFFRQKATAEIVRSINPDAVLIPGDVQGWHGTYDSYLLSFDPTWGLFKSITHPAIGDHDYEGDGYFRYFGAAAGRPDKTYYSFDLGGWHLVSLNSIEEEVDVYNYSKQIRWLKKDLAANKGKPILAFWHRPRYCSGKYGNNVAYHDFWQVLYKYHAKLVISGHDHVYERFAPQDANGHADPNGARQFVSGLGGEMIYQFSTISPNSECRYNATFGVLKLTLFPKAYEWEFIPEAGGTFTDKGRQSFD
ncbi:MAG TPA: hypothetical protein DD435_04440 [Cyanobacteria bacterium UBA8530]|nr:hypothetical protein [Cyanobacteria bacterium UBA8530]